jgi:hypothetical protein
LPIRRLGLQDPSAKPVVVPAAYLYLPSGEFAAESLQYTPGKSGLGIVGPVASTTITVDQNGFVRDYPGLAERI